MLEQLDALGEYVVTGGTGKIECRLWASLGQSPPVASAMASSGSQQSALRSVMPAGSSGSTAPMPASCSWHHRPARG